MSLAVLASLGLAGLEPLPVRVEVHVGGGLPSFQLVGQPDAGVRESRERVRAALVSSGFSFPAGRITVNLAPADLPKESGRFDLPIALGVLLASGQLRPPAALQPALDEYVFAGELSLGGTLMPIASPLALALGIARLSPQAALVLPMQGAGLASHVPGLRVLAAHSLDQVARHLGGGPRLPAAMPAPLAQAHEGAPCLSGVQGQWRARRALEIAASGQHSLLMAGPPGSGKSMLAYCLPGLLPPLEQPQALELAALASLCGEAPVLAASVPFRAPHHSASLVAMVGGGSGPRPGEISRAHHGVLFLDELPQFQRAVLDGLREPMETGHIALARATRPARFPCSFQLVAAMNACPCGWFGHDSGRCSCSPGRIRRYRQKLSGPFLDRLDLVLALRAGQVMAGVQERPESTGEVRERVWASRQRQMQRQQCSNARLDAAGVRRHCRLDATNAASFEMQAADRGWSMRAAQAVLRLARSVADLAGARAIAGPHLAEAMQYRDGPESSGSHA